MASNFLRISRKVFFFQESHVYEGEEGLLEKKKKYTKTVFVWCNWIIQLHVEGELF